MTDSDTKTDSEQGVLVAVCETNMVGSDEANTQAVRVFDIDGYEQSEKSMHEYVRPYLEKKLGTVENLRVHPTHVISSGSESNPDS